MPPHVLPPRKAQPGSNFQYNLRGWSEVCAIDWRGHLNFNKKFYPLTTFCTRLTVQLLRLQVYFSLNFFSYILAIILTIIERCHFAEGVREPASG